MREPHLPPSTRKDIHDAYEGVTADDLRDAKVQAGLERQNARRQRRADRGARLWSPPRAPRSPRRRGMGSVVGTIRPEIL